MPCDWLHGLIGNLIGQAAKKMPCVNESVKTEDVSKKGEKLERSGSEHRRSLFSFYLYVHVLVKLGGRCGKM